MKQEYDPNEIAGFDFSNLDHMQALVYLNSGMNAQAGPGATLSLLSNWAILAPQIIEAGEVSWRKRTPLVDLSDVPDYQPRAWSHVAAFYILDDSARSLSACVERGEITPEGMAEEIALAKAHWLTFVAECLVVLRKRAAAAHAARKTPPSPGPNRAARRAARKGGAA